MFVLLEETGVVDVYRLLDEKRAKRVHRLAFELELDEDVSMVLSDDDKTLLLAIESCSSTQPPRTQIAIFPISDF